MSLDLQVHGPCSALLFPGWGWWAKRQPAKGTAHRPPWALTCFWLNPCFLHIPHFSTTRRCVDSSCFSTGHTRVSEDLVGLQSQSSGQLAMLECWSILQAFAWPASFFFFFNRRYFFVKKTYLFIYCLITLGLPCCMGFPQLRQPGAALCCGAQVSHCGGFSCGAWAPGIQASVVTACRLSSCGPRAQECGFSGCGPRA